MNAEIFIDQIEESLSEVDPYYYGIDFCTEELLNMMGVDDNHPEIDKIRNYFSRYGERSFCYELYHKARIKIEKYYEENPVPIGEQPLILQAELKKDLISNIVDLLPGLNEELSKEYIPDFLFHTPPPNNRQEVVAEVKTSPRLSFAGIQKDLDKIQEFIQKYNYRLGVFLAVNSDPNRILNIIKSQDNLAWINDSILSKDRIIVLLKRNRETELVKFYLNDIP